MIKLLMVMDTAVLSLVSSNVLEDEAFVVVVVVAMVVVVVVVVVG